MLLLRTSSITDFHACHSTPSLTRTFCKCFRGLLCQIRNIINRATNDFASLDPLDVHADILDGTLRHTVHRRTSISTNF